MSNTFKNLDKQNNRKELQIYKETKDRKNKQACEWERFFSMYCIYYEALVYEVVTC